MNEQFTEITEAYARAVKYIVQKKVHGKVSTKPCEDGIIVEIDNYQHGYHRVVVKNLTNLLHYGLPTDVVAKRVLEEYKSLILSKYFRGKY